MARKKPPAPSRSAVSPRSPRSSGAEEPAAPFFRPFEGVAKEALRKVKEAEEKAKAEKVASTAGRVTPVTAKKPVRTAPVPSATSSLPEPAGSFADMLFGVTPLQRDSAARIPATESSVMTPSAPTGAPASSDEAVRAHLRQLVEKGRDERFEVLDDGQSISGCRSDVDKSTYRRLRRGELPIDAQCDLHGLNVLKARDLLEVTVAKRRDLRDRVVLVIHGRGNNSPRGESILRGEISAWLSQGPASVHVDAFATASDQDGGSGAIYVLLRRA